MRKLMRLLLLVPCLVLQPWYIVLVGGLIPPDGSCLANVMLQFSIEGGFVGQEEAVGTNLLTKNRLYSKGYMHLAVAMMAMEDFNTRNGRVVPELKNLQNNNGSSCEVYFDMNRSIFLDVGLDGLLGNHLQLQAAQAQEVPDCGMVGPEGDLQSLNTAVFAAAAQVPHLAYGGYNARLAQPSYSPMSTMLNPDIVQLGQAVGNYLLHIQRNRFIAHIYCVTDIGAQKAETLAVALDGMGIQETQQFPYTTSFFDGYVEPDRYVPNVLKKVLETGYRTIVVSLDIFIQDIADIANAAESLGMLNGDFVWILTPDFDRPTYHNLIQFPHSLLESMGLPKYDNVTKLLSGSALIAPVDQFEYLNDTDRFSQAWRDNGPELVDRVNHAYQNQAWKEGPNEMPLPSGFFQSYEPESGSGKLYDAIISLGMGACEAKRGLSVGRSGTQSGNHIDGVTHADAIRALDFSGASGHVKFGDPFSRNTNQTRNGDVVFGVYNLYPNRYKSTSLEVLRDFGYGDAYALTATVEGLYGPHTFHKLGTWRQYEHTFIFANGETYPPELLRAVPNQNYLSESLRITGLTFMGFALLLCAASLLFVWRRWSHRIIRASQPAFLCLLLIGSAVTSSAIFTISNDESYGWDGDQLSKACMATPWLFCLGHIITYGALFSKLWRVNQVLQFARRKVSVKAVAFPMIALFVCTAIVLITWTAHDSLQWVRKEINPRTGESIGQCDCDSLSIYISLVAVLMVIPTFLTVVMSWKTRDVDSAFSESFWIFILMVVQLQVILVSIPIVVLLRDESTDGRYLGLVLLIWSFPISTVMLIMGPKVVRYWTPGSSSSSGANSSINKRGVSQNGPRVSGVSGLSSGMPSSDGRDVNSEMESAFAKSPDTIPEMKGANDGMVD